MTEGEKIQYTQPPAIASNWSLNIAVIAKNAIAIVKKQWEKIKLVPACQSSNIIQ